MTGKSNSANATLTFFVWAGSTVYFETSSDNTSFRSWMVARYKGAAPGASKGHTQLGESVGVSKSDARHVAAQFRH